MGSLQLGAYSISALLFVIVVLTFSMFTYRNKYICLLEDFNKACNEFKHNLQEDCMRYKAKIAKRAIALSDDMEGLSLETKGAIKELLRQLFDPVIAMPDKCTNSDALEYVNTRMTELLNKEYGVKKKKHPVVLFVNETSGIMRKIEVLIDVPIVTSPQLVEKMFKARLLDWEMMIEVGKNKQEVISSKETSEYHSPEEANLELDENVEEVDTSETKTKPDRSEACH